MNNFDKIIYRIDTKSYIINNGTYTIPHPDDKTIPDSIHKEFDSLYAEVETYAKEHPDMVTEELPKIPSEPTFDELKTIKLTEINTAYDNAVSTLVSNYPSNELLTFDKQESEARAWVIDNNAETLLIDALALGRGIDKAELVSKILIKADNFAVAIGYLTGLRQKYEDQLAKVQTIEEITSIIPKYYLPNKEEITA